MTAKSLVKSSTSADLATVEQVRETAARAVARIENAYSVNTRRAYAATWRSFLAWCGPNSIDPAAATPEIVVTYLEHRLGHGLGGRACTREYGGLLAHLREIQPEGPWRSKSPPEIIKRWLRAARKQACPIVQKKPILPEHFAQLADPARFDSTRWLESSRDRALLLLGFAGGFRRSELVALDVEDLELRGEGVVVKKRRSKTDQEGEGLFVAVWRQEGHRCPVAALEGYLQGAKVESGPVFRRVAGHRLLDKRMSDRAVARIVKEAVRSLGLDPDAYGGHSLRCGFVTAAAKRGATIDEIMNTTGHRSAQQVISYIRRANPFDRNASKGMFEQSPLPVVPKPTSYEDDLGSYEPVMHDMGCGEPIAWGFRLLRHLGEERFEALRTQGELQCISMGKWCLVKRWLTPSEARSKYGDVVAIERGPRGGFRSITYGTKRFLNRKLDDPTVDRVAACGRGHVHEAGARAIGAFCTDGECFMERGNPLPIRIIAWRVRAS